MGSVFSNFWGLKAIGAIIDRVKGKDNSEPKAAPTAWGYKIIASGVANAKQAQAAIDTYVESIEKKGYHLVDDKGPKAGELFLEFDKLGVRIGNGEIYAYKKPHYRLISSGSAAYSSLLPKDKMNIMLSYSDL